MSEWKSSVILAPKPGGQFRLCIDYRKINTVSKADSYPLPRIDSCTDQIGTSTFTSKIDLMKGCWKVRLTLRAQEILTYVVNDQTYKCYVKSFGFKNAQLRFRDLCIACPKV